MIYPNIDCYYLCVWMLTVSKQRLTGPQITLTTAIRDAALANTSVSETEWNNFNQYAAWRNPYYLVYRDYCVNDPSSLLTGCVHYYDFEGNSNDLVGSANGADTAISYNTSYGIIGKGATNNTIASIIQLGSSSDFDFLVKTSNWSINFWCKFAGLSSNYYFVGSGLNSAQNQFLFRWIGGGRMDFVVSNSSGDGISPIYCLASSLLNSSLWQMVSIIADGTYYYVYINNVLYVKAFLKSFSALGLTSPLCLFKTTSLSPSAVSYFDELGFWDRALNRSEINTLYNSGAGLTYPF